MEPVRVRRAARASSCQQRQSLVRHAAAVRWRARGQAERERSIPAKRRPRRGRGGARGKLAARQGERVPLGGALCWQRRAGRAVMLAARDAAREACEAPSLLYQRYGNISRSCLVSAREGVGGGVLLGVLLVVLLGGARACFHQAACRTRAARVPHARVLPRQARPRRGRCPRDCTARPFQANCPWRHTTTERRRGQGDAPACLDSKDPAKDSRAAR